MSLALDCTTQSIVGFYDVAGKRLQVTAESEEVDRRVRRFISGLYISPSVPSSELAHDIWLDCYASRPKALPFGLEHFEVPHGRCHVSNDNYFIEVQDWLVSFGTVDPRKVTLTFGNTGSRQDRWNRLTAMSYAVQAVLRRGQLFDLHAAALACPATGDGILIIGPSGSGKSSLSVRLASQGWKYLSDDTSIAYTDGTRVCVSGLRRPMTVSPSSIAAAVPGVSLERFEVLPEDPGKVRVEPSEVFPGSFIERMTPKLVLFSSVGEGSNRSTARPLSQAESLTRLLRLCPWAAYDPFSSRPFIGLLTSLVRQASSYEFVAGRDVYDNSEFTSSLISSFLR